MATARLQKVYRHNVGKTRGIKPFFMNDKRGFTVEFRGKRRFIRERCLWRAPRRAGAYAVHRIASRAACGAGRAGQVTTQYAVRCMLYAVRAACRLGKESGTGQNIRPGSTYSISGR